MVVARKPGDAVWPRPPRHPADDLVWLVVSAGGAALAAAFAWLAPPLSNLYPAPILDVFPAWKVLIHPEPLEDVRAIHCHSRLPWRWWWSSASSAARVRSQVTPS